MVEQKNADELFQNFVFHTQAVDTNSLKDHTSERAGESLSLDKGKVKEDGDQAAKHLRTSLILTNSEVRKLLSDFSLIGRDLLSIGASKASTLIAPPEHKLARVDEPALQDQFVTHDPNHPDGQRIAGPNETPSWVARSRFRELSVARTERKSGGECGEGCFRRVSPGPPARIRRGPGSSDGAGACTC
ncbi:hypothetical protein FA13DRAFT_1466716 [Coprinellus micaceus]|uniref:HAM1-like N-terminal domain-containing protein n=1 Tax=Coprinellus micaceus TaxID=71717 RepID=A0A4Y7SNH5_COPMI|nr:hypothetical protein FA13DRAFT_1466716 [Coprinellus micaceus]